MLNEEEFQISNELDFEEKLLKEEEEKTEQEKTKPWYPADFWNKQIKDIRPEDTYFEVFKIENNGKWSKVELIPTTDDGRTTPPLTKEIIENTLSPGKYLFQLKDARTKKILSSQIYVKEPEKIEVMEPRQKDVGSNEMILLTVQRMLDEFRSSVFNVLSNFKEEISSLKQEKESKSTEKMLELMKEITTEALKSRSNIEQPANRISELKELILLMKELDKSDANAQVEIEKIKAQRDIRLEEIKQEAKLRGTLETVRKALKSLIEKAGMEENEELLELIEEAGKLSGKEVKTEQERKSWIEKAEQFIDTFLTKATTFIDKMNKLQATIQNKAQPEIEEVSEEEVPEEYEDEEFSFASEETENTEEESEDNKK